MPSLYKYLACLCAAGCVTKSGCLIVMSWSIEFAVPEVALDNENDIND